MLRWPSDRGVNPRSSLYRTRDRCYRSPIASPIAHPPDLVHIVSHGPHCLDGVTSAVAVARFHAGLEVHAHFANNPEINDAILAVPPAPAGRRQELWITDISWNRADADAHLRALAAAGTRVVWIDHHRTAIERLKRGGVDVPFGVMVVEDTYAASRLVYEHLERRLAAEGRTPSGRLEHADAFRALAKLVALADDNDRWIHALPGSRELALTVGAMRDATAYQDLLGVDADVGYTPAMREAEARVTAEVAATHALAERTRCARPVGDVTVLAAWCAGYPSEIGDAWGKATPNAVIALYDTKSDGVSFRRSPACPVDLSRVAETFGGGGHAAAAGCKIPGMGDRDADALADLIAGAVASERGGRETPG
jgi:oligoribonuclease NrnB/cAMP/cGMP phosphodiesterase (DHH superfamily)